MTVTLDYARFGRQIALAEIGADGQRALAERAVCFVGDGATDAASAHVRAGGSVSPEGLRVEVATARGTVARRGLAAFAAVEAARRVLGQAPAHVPAALAERLALDPA